MPDEPVSALDSDDVSQYDVLTDGYRQRLATAMTTLRGQSYYSEFDSIPAAPQADPQPAADDEDIGNLDSNKVSHYDGLSSTHQSEATTEAARYDDELDNYISYYNAHHATPYTRPTSQVQPIDVVDDQSPTQLDTNRVDGYDTAASGYSSISASSTTTTGTRNTAFPGEMSTATGKLNALKTGNNSIPTKFQQLSNQVDDKYNQDRQNITQREQMSVKEALKSDKNSISNKLDASVTQMHNGLIHVEDIH